MERYGNICFNRRVVAFVCLLFVALSILMPADFVKADTYTIGICNTNNENGIRVPDTNGWYASPGSFECNGSPLYRWDDVTFASDQYHHRYGYFSVIFQGDVSSLPSNFDKLVKTVGSVNYTLIYNSQSTWSYSDYINRKAQQFYTDSDYNIINPNSFQSTANYKGSPNEFMSSILDRYISGDIGTNVNSPTKVTNESIGYLQDVKLNLSYVTPIKGDSIFETTNYQIYSDMVYNLKWNSKKTSTNYDLSSSYVQLYAKAEYKNDSNDNTASDFFALSDNKASIGKYKVSFMDLFEKSDKCKNLYLSDFPLASADYKNGKLQACSVTSNIKYKFYIRVYKGTDKGPWLCVTEKGSHISNEFVNSGDDVKYNVSSGEINSDGSFTPDGNVNENGTGTTGTGKDAEDADADTNANDKIQSKHDSSDNSVWDNLENLVSGIASVPIIIKDIFSFLPSWCLNVTATGFALMITVCVIRFVRGK